MDDNSKADIYSATGNTSTKQFMPKMMNKGAVTQITMDGIKFDVVKTEVIDALIEQIHNLKQSNNEIKEHLRMQSIKMAEFKTQIQNTKNSIRQLVADISKNNWK